MRKIGQLNTKDLLYNPKDKTFVADLKRDIPEAKDYRGKIGAKIFFTYMVLMYDINSPLWREIPDYYQRKYEAAVISGFPAAKKQSNEKGNEFTEGGENVILGKVNSANDVVMAYIAKFALPEYFQLIAYTAILSAETQKVLKSGAGSSSTKIIDDAGGRIRELQKIVFNSGKYDEIKEMKQALYSRLEKERLRLRPEEILKEMQERGELPKDFSPYSGPPTEAELADKYLRFHIEGGAQNEV